MAALAHPCQATNPITLDGHGATLSCAEPAQSSGWTLWKDVIHQRTDFVSDVFLVVNEQLVLEPNDCDMLKPGEICCSWSYYDRLLLALEPLMKPADYHVEVGQPDGSTITLAPAKWMPAPRGGDARAIHSGC